MLVTPKSFSQRLGYQALGRSITAAEEVDARRHAMLDQYDAGIAPLRGALSEKVWLQISDGKICTPQVVS